MISFPRIGSFERTLGDLLPVPRPYTVATLLVATAFFIRMWLNVALGHEYIYGTFYVAIAAAAWYGRLKAGVFAAVLSGIATAYLSLLGGISAIPLYDVVEWLLFLAGSALICFMFAAHRSADEAQATLKALVDATPVGIALIDRNMRYRMVNDVLAKMNGIPAEEHIGKTVADVVPDLVRNIQEPFERALEGATPVDFFEFEGEAPARPGEKRIWSQCWFAVRVRDARPFLVGTTVQDVTDERRNLDLLMEADQNKDEAIGVVAHELATPLSAISSACHLLMRSREMDLGLLAIIDRQSDHCIRLIGDLRDITRIRAGKVELRLDVLGLEPLMAQVADVVAPVLKSKTQTLEIIPPDTWISVRADGTRLVQILVNVINNASKFSPAGGAIRMSARADERSVEIEIRDWGIGMRPQDIPKIFTRWEQLSESGSGLGLGLGLAVARRLAELHGGTLTAESAGPGEGSEFRLTLPLDPHPSPAGR